MQVKAKSLQTFRKHFTNRSNYFDAWFNLGVAKSKAGLEEALICFRQAHQQKNDHVLLNANIIILQDLNRIDDAWKEIEKPCQQRVHPQR